MIPSDRARARDGRLAGLWILAPQGLRASPTRSIFVTLTFRVLTPMISTRHGRVQAPLGYRAARRATTTAGYRPVRADRRRCARAVLGRTGAVHDGPAGPHPVCPPGAPSSDAGARPPLSTRGRRAAGPSHYRPYGPTDGTVRAPRGRTRQPGLTPLPSWTPSNDAEVPDAPRRATATARYRPIRADRASPGALSRAPSSDAEAPAAPCRATVPPHCRPLRAHRRGRPPRTDAEAGGREPGPVTAVTCSGTRPAQRQHSASRLRTCRRARAP